MAKFDCVVVHYDEIFLKGNNRVYFEIMLAGNIKAKMAGLFKSLVRETAQITLELNDDANHDKVSDILSKVPGIAYFSFAKRSSLDMDKLKKEVVEFLEGVEFSTFKIDTRRHSREQGVKSMDMNSVLGEVVMNSCKKKVKLKDPDLTVKVEVSSKNVYLSYDCIEGVGGFPTNPKQKVVALISGGFDSPVAAFMMMKRGCEVVLVHFRNKNQMSSLVEGKISGLVKQLSKFQQHTVLYVVPFDGIQKEIIMKVQSDIRMLVYRRFMIKIASRIAEMNGAKFLVVGDSLSQVASQTLENLEATYIDSEKHILSPLIGLNKKEIIGISQRIGTFGISSQPYGDCCSYFLPKHPVLKARIGTLQKIEQGFDVESLVSDAVKNARVENF